jgi:hypothetical protein
MFSSSINEFTNPLPPKEVHFLELKVEPWEDKSRLKIFVKISQFSIAPNLNFFIKDKENSLLSEVTLIENIETDFVFTMHLRNYSDQKDLCIFGEIFYGDEIGVVNSISTEFSLS